MSAGRGLTESLEDYLEAIFHIVEEKRAARGKDIADRLGVSSASVTGALRALADRRLINHAPYDLVTLTRAGAEVAASIVRRHEAIREFLVNVLRVQPEEAEACACRMEHAMPDAVLDRFAEFLRFAKACPAVSGWVPGKEA